MNDYYYHYFIIISLIIIYITLIYANLSNLSFVNLNSLQKCFRWLWKFLTVKL